MINFMFMYFTTIKKLRKKPSPSKKKRMGLLLPGTPIPRQPLAIRSWFSRETGLENTRGGGGGASLVAQWLRIRLPMQGTRVRSLAREDPTCRGATKPVRHNYWAWALEPSCHNYWAHMPQLLKPAAPRARAPQQEKLRQWEARAPQWRVAPAHCN